MTHAPAAVGKSTSIAAAGKRDQVLMQRILVLEDDTDINRLLCRILAKAGYETIAAYSGTEAQLRLERETPDVNAGTAIYV